LRRTEPVPERGAHEWHWPPSCSAPRAIHFRKRLT
jgi:hypothetical protein